MIAAKNNSVTTLNAEIFLRLWDKQKLTLSLARQLLKMGFDEDDQTRIHELAQKNRDGSIGKAELAELDDFIHVGGVLTILQSRARKVLGERIASSRVK